MKCQEAMQALNLKGWRDAMDVLKIAQESMEKTDEEFKRGGHYRFIPVCGRRNLLQVGKHSERS